MQFSLDGLANLQRISKVRENYSKAAPQKYVVRDKYSELQEKRLGSMQARISALFMDISAYRLYGLYEYAVSSCIVLSILRNLSYYTTLIELHI